MKIVFSLLLKCMVVAVCSWGAAWIAYSMNSRIAQGFFSAGDARLLTFELAGIVCLLLLPVQALAPILHKEKSRPWIVIMAFFEGLIVLSAYAGFVWGWRQNWNISKGFSENAAFVPFMSHVNATFFSGFDGLAFVIGVIPAAAAIAAVLTLAGSRITATTQ